MTTKTVLVTGATGNLGRKIVKHFRGIQQIAVKQICLNPLGDPDVLTADLSIADETWTEPFSGVDIVVHLAGNPSPAASWGDIQKANIDLTLNVFEAARKKGVKRVVFASSNWVMAGYRFSDLKLTTSLQPSPVNPYGISKLLGERAGLHLLTPNGVSFIALRIGYCQRLDGNRPGPHMAYGHWGQEMWLSDADLCRGFERAVLAEGNINAVLNLMSNNDGMRWDMEETSRVIGFSPLDGHTPTVDDHGERSNAVTRPALDLLNQLSITISSKL